MGEPIVCMEAPFALYAHLVVPQPSAEAEWYTLCGGNAAAWDLRKVFRTSKGVCQSCSAVRKLLDEAALRLSTFAGLHGAGLALQEECRREMALFTAHPTVRNTH